MRKRIVVPGIVVLLGVAYVGYQVQEHGIWWVALVGKPQLVDAPAPDDVGVQQALEVQLEGWDAALAQLDNLDQASEFRFDLAIKHGEQDDSLWLGLKRLPRYGEVDETAGPWADAPIYRYEIASNSLIEVQATDWPSSFPDAQFNYAVSDWAYISRPDHEDDSIVFLDSAEKVYAFAKNIVDISLSPSRRWAGVVSAAGKHRWEAVGWLPYDFRKSAGADGQHYYQTMRIADGRYLGQPIRLPLKNTFNRTPMPAWWTKDERYVIYYMDARLTVIATGVLREDTN